MRAVAVTGIECCVGRTLRSSGWGGAALYAGPVALGVLSLFTYWFAVADRYAIFLYGHQGTTPFDAMTRSRYWMAGLVASGVALSLYIPANWLAGRVAGWRGRAYRPPPWQRVWLLCAPPLAVGIPAITMTLNRPTLPLLDALGAALATLAGVALSLIGAEWAAARFAELAWLALDGAGLIPVLQLFVGPERAAMGLINTQLGWGAAATGLVASVAWLGLMTALRAWKGVPGPRAGELLLAGLARLDNRRTGKTPS
jgi:hypothetical protein